MTEYELPSIFGSGIPPHTLDGHATLRIPMPNPDGRIAGYRNIDLARLVAIARSDDGWEAINRIFRSMPEPAIGEVWDFTDENGYTHRFMRTANGWVDPTDTNPDHYWDWQDIVDLGNGSQVAGAVTP